MDSELAKIAALIEQASHILETKETLPVEEALGLVDSYVEAFEVCRVGLEQFIAHLNYKNAKQGDQQFLKSEVIRLNEIHKAVIVYASELKQTLLKEMADVHQKTKVVKHYVDRYPATISLTGKRKG